MVNVAIWDLALIVAISDVRSRLLDRGGRLYPSDCDRSWLSSTGGGAEGRPLSQFAPTPEIWSQNNRKISITKEICKTIDFAPS